MQEIEELQFKNLVKRAIIDYLNSQTSLPEDIWDEVSNELTEFIYDRTNEWMVRSKTN